MVQLFLYRRGMIISAYRTPAAIVGLITCLFLAAPAIAQDDVSPQLSAEIVLRDLGEDSAAPRDLIVELHTSDEVIRRIANVGESLIVPAEPMTIIVYASPLEVAYILTVEPEAGGIYELGMTLPPPDVLADQNFGIEWISGFEVPPPVPELPEATRLEERSFGSFVPADVAWMMPTAGFLAGVLVPVLFTDPIQPEIVALSVTAGTGLGMLANFLFLSEPDVRQVNVTDDQIAAQNEAAREQWRAEIDEIRQHNRSLLSRRYGSLSPDLLLQFEPVQETD